ncbi:MAG: DMT family transporter [Terriglobia bacterium]
MNSRSKAELGLVAVTIIWGTTFVLVKYALQDVSPVVFLALRFSIAALLLGAIFGKAVRRPAILPGIGAGCLLFLAYVFQTKGLELTSASKSAFITGLSIPLVPFFNSFVYRIRPRLIEVAGILIASAGMALMTLPATGFGMSRGDFLSFLCAVTFALHIVVISHYSRALGFQTIAVTQIAAAALLSVVLFRFVEPFRFHPTAGVAGAVLVTAVLATALAFTVMAWSQQYTTATRSAIIFTLEPVVAWFTSWAIAGETMPLRGKLGAVTILAGVLLVELTGSSETRSPDQASQK